MNNNDDCPSDTITHSLWSLKVKVRVTLLLQIYI